MPRVQSVVCRSISSPADLVLSWSAGVAPGPAEVVIEVAAAGVNFTDVLMTTGRYQDRHQPPFVPGSEVAGTIVRAGEGVSTDVLGTRVMALCRTGGFADEVVVPAEMAVAVPDSVDLHRAAAFPIAYGTAYRALLERTRIAVGERLLVLGSSGSVGSAAAQIGLASGAEVFVAGTDRSRLDPLVALGAVPVIVSDPSELPACWRDHHGPRPLDVVVDPVGGDWGRGAQRILADGGRLAILGFASGEIPVFEANRLLLRNHTVHGVFGGPFLSPTDSVNTAAVASLVDGLAAGRWSPTIGRRLPLSEAGSALADIGDRSRGGRILLVTGAAP